MENFKGKRLIIGERITLLREANGWVLGRFASKLRMTIADCLAIENGTVKISQSQLTKMAEVLCVDVDRLGSAKPQNIDEMLADSLPKFAYKRKPRYTLIELEDENERLRTLLRKKESEIATLQQKLIVVYKELNNR